MKTYDFDKNTPEIQRDAITLGLRRDGFIASRETDTLRTDAKPVEIALSCGHGGKVREQGAQNVFPGGRWTTKPVVKIDPGYMVQDSTETCPECRRKLVFAPEGAGIVLWCKNSACKSPVMSEGAEAATVAEAFAILEAREEKRPMQ